MLTKKLPCRVYLSMTYTIKTIKQLSIALRSARKSKHITQAVASENFGILPKTISLLENNAGRASIESLFKLLGVIGYDITLTPRGQQPSDWNGEW